MSRVAFFTESLPPSDDPIASFSFDLIKTLADQQHEVRVFSTFHEGRELPSPHSRIEILRPFKNWGWLELPRVLPLLIEFQPEVIHLIQPRAEALSGWTNAMSAIPSFSPLIGKPAIVSSFYDLDEEVLKSHRLLLGSSHVVTASNQPQIELLETYVAGLRSRPKTAVVPVSTRILNTREEAPDHFVRRFIEEHPRTLFVPGSVDEHRERERIFGLFAEVLARDPAVTLVFGGDWGRISPRERHHLLEKFGAHGDRVLVSGHLDPRTLNFCLTHAHVTFLASLSLTSLKLTQVMSEALASGAVLIITREQALATAVPWKDRENAFLIEDTVGQVNEAQIRRALRDATENSEKMNGLINRMRGRIPDFARAESLDEPANKVSRLYSEALLHRSRFSR